mmetsp:Transcript_3456/g.4646  ORF Transcript_3456/g.4646 Transcript_3456/m.4646 type:complete len:147 (-) Transcript_3456:134-574(-)|eukprot:CAMPEP_0206425572 /NCGR_PEP_ID=MMETSP0324_2-20121206/3866_1 /ASSEMBLY_ACC=CAM_ASM_000836 /TAXON_ID=2866 /ORGANISM="Crypthecodinium cohnii, Strain Seligo" /LENGTH=146 /DNA_ID=CAMNT_0053890369 /DNA_START=49 /DNA_END=489 /DNA_ORIENTATION=+
MPAIDGPDAEEGSSVELVKQQLAAAQSTMQDNMRAMAERDSQLNNLQERTHDLQGSSSAFARASRRVRSAQQQMYRRLIIVSILLLSWVIVWFVARDYLFRYTIVLLLGVAATYAVQTFMENRDGRLQDQLLERDRDPENPRTALD